MTIRKRIFDLIRAARGKGWQANDPQVGDIDSSLTRWGVPAGVLDGGRLGNLSMRYETGYQPGEEARAAAKVSSGRGDPGGKSYGAYQLASLKGQVTAFLKAEGAPWASELAGLDPTRAGAFEERWKTIAARDRTAFFDAQHAYIERTHYAPVAQHARVNGIDVDTMPKAVRDVLWSMAVQHAGAKKIVSDAIMRLAGARDPAGVVNALYDARRAYVRGIDLHPDTRASLLNRYASERADALRMLESAA